MINKILTFLFFMATFSIANAFPVVHMSDFINDGDRTNFNGFESIPVTSEASGNQHYSGGNGPYIEDGISVEQVNGDGDNSIWTSNLGPGSPGIQIGLRSWYPNGGDNGYTQITRSSGVDFINVGMTIGSGSYPELESLPIQVFYELLNKGNTILSGNYIADHAHYLGFSGGGFDTIRLNDCYSCNVLTTTVTDGHLQALALDSIEVSAVPEPSTWLLLVSGLAILVTRKIRRNDKIL